MLTHHVWRLVVAAIFRASLSRTVVMREPVAARFCTPPAHYVHLHLLFQVHALQVWRVPQTGYLFNTTANKVCAL